MPGSRSIIVTVDADILAARREARMIAERQGLNPGDATLVATAVSEVARNIVTYARSGEIFVRAVTNGARRGVEIIARDSGPGIADVVVALRDGYSTGGSLGIGLPGARRIMDDFDIESELGRGTTVRMTKWAR